MRFYVTTPIYYVNDVPHIGHAYTTIAADIVARHRRQRGDETFFLTGIDEHGTKVRRSPRQQGCRPQEYVDRISDAWRELPGRIDAEPDFFIRTSDPQHAEFVRDFLQRIYDNGDVYEDVYAGLYCVGCEAFKLESELVDGRCPDHANTPLEYLEEKNYFFRLSAYQDRLLQLYDERRRSSCCRGSATTRPAASSRAACTTSRSAGRARRGASRCRGTRARSPTSGPTRSSTT